MATAAELFDDFRAYERSLALRTAIELGLFTRIGGGAGTVAALARATRAAPRGIGALCDYLTAQGHLIKRAGCYRLAAHSRLYLDSTSPTYIGAAIEFLACDENVASFCRLRSAVRQGGAARPDIDWTKFARSMACAAQPIAEFAAEALLDPKHKGILKILDLAAGHGLYGLACAARNPAAQVYALDSAPVLRIARANARKAGLTAQWNALPGDALQRAFGGPYDLILAANFAHHLDETGNLALFVKCRAALKPGGRLALLDLVPNADRVSPPLEAAFALHLLATTPRGTVYTFAEYQRILRSAGFSQIRHPQRWLITASKPSPKR